MLKKKSGLSYEDVRERYEHFRARCSETSVDKIVEELKKIKKCAKYANFLGIEVHAGHGMDYKTTRILSKIKEIKEFNIGHFIIGEAISIGLKNTIKKILLYGLII